MDTLQSETTEGAIWNRLLQSTHNELSLDAAKSLLALEFAQEDNERMRELAEKARDGSLTVDEQEQIRSYERVGNLLALVKSKARQRLKKRPRPNGASQ